MGALLGSTAKLADQTSRRTARYLTVATPNPPSGPGPAKPADHRWLCTAAVIHRWTWIIGFPAILLRLVAPLPDCYC